MYLCKYHTIKSYSRTTQYAQQTCDCLQCSDTVSSPFLINAPINKCLCVWRPHYLDPLRNKAPLALPSVFLFRVTPTPRPRLDSLTPNDNRQTQKSQ